MKLRDYPRSIVIGETIWSVKFCRCVPGHDAGTVGITDPSDEIIYIRLGLSPRERLQTFIHETLHAIEYELGINLPHDLIDALDYHLAVCLMDNFIGRLAHTESQSQVSPKRRAKMDGNLRRRFPIR